MARILVQVNVDAASSVVWEELRHIDRHVEWMMDARSIAFESEQREGVGTSFECVTRVGPFVTRDHMTITEWSANECMGIEHRGIVRGSGRISLHAMGTATKVIWEENLRFPWWALGEVGAQIAKPILVALWRGNLARLARIISEADG